MGLVAGTYCSGRAINLVGVGVREGDARGDARGDVGGESNAKKGPGVMACCG
jgi:hypothetical protein